MRHGSLFSGIEGFGLAAERMGWENVFQVEIDKWCQKVLAKNFPDTLRFGDINEFNERLRNGEIITDTRLFGQGFGEEQTTGIEQYSKKRINLGRIDIITGGFPCQPFSHAGKRKGTDDSRYLWPAMLETIRILKPTYVVGENVAGLISMENGRTLERIFFDLENEGYEIESFIIPACAVGAWHRRDRIWIIAYHANTGIENLRKQENKICRYKDVTNNNKFNDDGTGFPTSKISQQQKTKIFRNTFADTQKAKCESTRDTRTGGNGFTNSCKDVSDTVSQRLQTRRKWNVSGNKEQSSKNYAKTENWWQSEPDVGRVAHGIPGTLDRINGINYETIRKELFALWQKDDPTRMGKWRERFNIQEQEILQFAMLWLLDRINIERKENEWKENCSTKIQINNLRTMWIERIIAEASQRWQYEEQQSKEHNNSLPGLPQERTPKEWNMGSIWNEEPNTPRVASGVRDRVDRLKGLGNAIVPQIAYELFKVIEQFNSINTAKQ